MRLVLLENQIQNTENIYCSIVAVKPGRYSVTIYVAPFFSIPIDFVIGEKAVLVFEGPIANPNFFSRYLVIGMDTEFSRVKVVVDNVNSDWSAEIANIFKSYQPPIEATPSIIYTPAPSILTKCEARELLECVVAEALKSLGFTSVQTNVNKSAKMGASIEVDVWAEKRVGDSRFKVYVSCKNWNRDVNRSIVDEEFGRVLNLLEVPHLRILIVRSISEPAKKVAEADGFFVIELGEKASETNVQRIYEYVYQRLSEIFTSIAPPQLLEIARKVSKTAEELSRIAQELEKLSRVAPIQ